MNDYVSVHAVVIMICVFHTRDQRPGHARLAMLLLINGTLGLWALRLLGKYWPAFYLKSQHFCVRDYTLDWGVGLYSSHVLKSVTWVERWLQVRMQVTSPMFDLQSNAIWVSLSHVGSILWGYRLKSSNNAKMNVTAVWCICQFTTAGLLWDMPTTSPLQR